MQIDKSNKLFPFFVFSLCLHLIVLFAIFYNTKKEENFIQIPIDVNFISPVETNNFANNNPAKSESATEKYEKKAVVKETKKEIDKYSIKIEKKSKKKEAKKKTEEKKQKVKEKPKKEVNKEVTKETSVQKENDVFADAKTGSDTDPFNVPSNSGSKGVMFENTNFKFSYYANSIVKKIRRNWQWAGAYRALRAVIYFKINRDGDVVATRIKESSGNSDFDENATRAIILSSPFAPLPEAYTEDDLGVYFEFKFN